MKNLLDFITEHWAAISVLILAIGIRVIPTEKNYDILKNIVRIIDYIIPNLKKGGGKHTIRIILFMIISNFCLAQTNGNFKSIRLTNGDSVQSGTANGTIFYNRVSNKFRFRQNGAWISIPTGSGISGLTANRVPYAASATSLTDNALFTFDPVNIALTMNGQRLFGSSTNTFLGPSAGNLTNSGATGNVAFGANSMQSLTNGDNNTYVGALSGLATTQALNNTLIGYGSGAGITTGDDHVVVGHNAMVQVTTADRNVAIGSLALQTATGGNNIQVGYGNPNITTGTNNIIIGHDIDIATNTASGQLNIQNIIYGTDNTATGTTLASGEIGIGIKAPLAQLHVKGNEVEKALLTVESQAGPSLMEVYNDGFDGNVVILNTDRLAITCTNELRINNDLVPYILSGGAALNFPSTAAQTSSDLTFTLTGAEIGDPCILSTTSPSTAYPANSSYSAWVSDADEITVRFNNYSTGAIDPTGGGTVNYSVRVIKTHP